MTTLDHFQVDDSGEVRLVTSDGAWEKLSPAVSRAVVAQISDLHGARLRGDAAVARVRELERKLLDAHGAFAELGVHTCDGQPCPCPWIMRTSLSAAANLTHRLYAEEL